MMNKEKLYYNRFYQSNTVSINNATVIFSMQQSTKILLKPNTKKIKYHY